MSLVYSQILASKRGPACQGFYVMSTCQVGCGEGSPQPNTNDRALKAPGRSKSDDMCISIPMSSSPLRSTKVAKCFPRVLGESHGVGQLD